MPIVSGDQTILLLTVLIGVVLFGMWSETRRWGKALSGALVILLSSMALSNFGIIPHSADLYGSIASFLVPLAIPMLLLRADLRRVISGSGRMLKAFSVAVIATLGGALVGAWLIDLGQSEAHIVAMLTAGYVGGSVNFVATSEAIQFDNPAQYLAALSADAVGAIVFLLLLFAMPMLAVVRKLMPSRYEGERDCSTEISPDEEALDFTLDGNGNARFSAYGLVLGLFISLLIFAGALWLSEWFGVKNLLIPAITVLALLVANFAKPVVEKVQHEFEVGTVIMYTFFAAIGAGANLSDIIGAAFPILIFVFILVTVHLVILTLLGHLCKLDMAEALVASNACCLGPATAAAMAAGKNWKPLVVPGMLVGILGYSIATFIGMGMFWSLI